MSIERKTVQLAIAGSILLPFYLSAGSMDKSAADTTFGVNGKVLEVLSADHGGARNKAVLIEADDRIIVAGYTKNADNDNVLALYKYLPDGARDVSFGIGGASYTDHVCQDKTCGTKFVHGKEYADSILLQSDGKIIVTRTDYTGTDGYDPDPYFGVVRFNRDGTLDRSYGYSGYNIATPGINFAYATSGAIQPDDKVVVAGAGEIDSVNTGGAMVSRFNADGSLDTNFATQGTFYMNPNFAGYSEHANDVTVQADGKILIAGETYVQGCGEDTSTHFTRSRLIRLNPDGSLDHSFNGDGVLEFNIYAIFDVDPWDLSETNTCSNNYFKSVKVQADGKIVVLGRGYGAIFIARFNPNGTLDTSFGYQGARMVYENYDYTTFDHLNTHFTYVWGRKFSVENMMLGKNGNIVVSGQITYDDDYYHYGFMAMHFRPDGSFDTRYGTIGDARVDVNFPNDFLYGGATAYALGEQSDGKVILAGYADGYDAPSTAVTTRTVKEQPEAALPAIIGYLLN